MKKIPNLRVPRAMKLTLSNPEHFNILRNNVFLSIVYLKITKSGEFQ